MMTGAEVCAVVAVDGPEPKEEVAGASLIMLCRSSKSDPCPEAWVDVDGVVFRRREEVDSVRREDVRPLNEVRNDIV